MTISKTSWAKFSQSNSSFDYAGEKLKKSWLKLHEGDCEPFPDEKRASALLKTAGKAAPKGLSANELAEQLQEAWRAFHRGDFQQAYTIGESLGPIGASVACKAMGIHATYLVDDEKQKLARFEHVAQLAQAAIEALPDEANSHYRHGFALGRYGQGISIAKTLKMGLAGKIRQSLQTCLELEPKHAEAHLAMAIYHAEIVGKVGGMIAGVTYGAKAAEAEKHIKTALKLAADMPIVHVEHAAMLLALYGSKQEDAAADAYEKASQLKARDAMDKLDSEFAKAQIE